MKNNIKSFLFILCICFSLLANAQNSKPCGTVYAVLKNNNAEITINTTWIKGNCSAYWMVEKKETVLFTEVSIHYVPGTNIAYLSVSGKTDDERKFSRLMIIPLSLKDDKFILDCNAYFSMCISNGSFDTKASFKKDGTCDGCECNGQACNHTLISEIPEDLIKYLPAGGKL